MKYLSIDLEATGLLSNDYITEVSVVPFDTKTGTLEENLGRTFYLKCPSFEQLKPRLSSWVIKNNKKLIQKAHEEGIPLKEFRKQFEEYLSSKEVKKYFSIKDYAKKQIMLFGKSMNAIDLPFLKRDLGFDFVDKYFCHHILDLTSVVYSLADMDYMDKEYAKSSKLMKFLDMGKVQHTSYADAKNTVLMYFKLIRKFGNSIDN